MKIVLIASFYFPPYADVANVRALKFCKYLPENGWEPWVVTVDKRYYGTKVVKQLPPETKNIKCIRLPYIPIPAAKTFASLAFPLFILLTALMNRKSIDAACMIGSPFHPFIITPVLTSIFKIPACLDFRDVWTYKIHFDGKPKKANFFLRTANRLYHAIEKVSLKHASFATFATSILRDEYAELIPEYADKYHTIFNGYDEDDFKNIVPVSLTDNKSIIVAGKLYMYTPEAVTSFLELIREMNDLTLIYIGGEYDTINALAAEIGVEKKVIAMEYQPYDYVLQLIAGSNYCLLSSGLVNLMGTKIFDYLALKKPTLCLVPKGSIITKRFSNILGIVISEEPHSKEQIKKKLAELLTMKSLSTLRNNDEFSRRNGAKALAMLLDKALPQRKRFHK